MSTTSSIYEQLEETFQSGGIEPTLEKLCQELDQAKKYHELFEARKLLLRHQLGLPLLYSGSGDELDESVQNGLEDGLAAICKEVGRKLFEAGKLREGWMYLRPVGDVETARSYLTKAEVDDEEVEELIELALREGIAPALGFSLVLEHYGTCNSITTFDAEMSQHSIDDRRAAAGMLVEHLHAELLENVKNDIRSEEGSEPEGNRFKELLADREWLFDGNRYHIDTTHLASVVRFARVISNEEQLRLALDLTEYGKRLSEQYQYENEEPFAQFYPASQFYFQAALHENVDEAIAYFEQKAKACDAYNEGYMAIEVYIELLARAGKTEAAIEALIEMMPDAAPRIGIAPSVVELSSQLGDFGRFTEFCRKNEDLLGFTTGLLHRPN